MTPEQFVLQVRKWIVEDNLSLYKDIFRSFESHAATDAHWKRALGLFSSLNDDDRKVLLEIIRQTIVDTVSSMFAVLDGKACLEGQSGEFILLAGSPPLKLSGDLQDCFLEYEEEVKSKPDPTG